MQEQSGFWVVGIKIKVVNSLGVECRGSSNQTVNFIAFGEQKLRQIGAVLTCDSSYECFFQRLPDPKLLVLTLYS